MAAKVHRVMKADRVTTYGWLFRCPGCELVPLTVGLHVPRVGPNEWDFNGDLERPTFSPSIKVTYDGPTGPFVCHSFVRDGRIEYLGDCTHPLAGKTVDLPDWVRPGD